MKKKKTDAAPKQNFLYNNKKGNENKNFPSC
jgi:hypothetical protein